jgi:small-conductance mechanosensitive channel
MEDLGPAFGMVFIAFRLALASWLALLVLRVTRAVADPLPMLLLSFSGYIIVMGQITGQGTINLFGWLFTGLLIAACRHARAPQAVHRTATGRPLARKNSR